MVWLIGVEEGWMGVLHGEGGAAAMAEAAVFWASGEGVAQCFGLERVEGNEGERLGSVVREVSGFGEGNRKGGGGRWRVERGDCGGAWHGKDSSSARGKAVRSSGATRGS